MAMLPSPKLKRDWVGRSVILKQDVETQSGVVFPAGTVCRVKRNYKGLALEYTEACDQCKLKWRTRINRVPERDVLLLEEP